MSFTINTLRPEFNYNQNRHVDLDKDGDPDLLYTFINDSIPALWIDDDDDMTVSALKGDFDNDCLLIDRNRDGKYGSEMDLIVDWVDTNTDGKADLQIIADNASLKNKGWTPGHYMICIDTDNDGVLNYIDWNKLQLEPWDRIGQCDFMQDYSGKTILLKTHTSTFNMQEVRYNWENPFLFYDPDKDGRTEYAIRFMDKFSIDPTQKYPFSLSGKISDVRMSWDLDDDNAPGNEFDFDMSLLFRGKGFDYSKYVHRFQNMKGLQGTDSFFVDARWRNNDELIYVEHEKAYEQVFSPTAEWNECWLVFDEDDDCQRWERVEFYEPKDLYKNGARNGGLDTNPQADVSGDRGEWDADFSGKGQLYISPLDGKIHLYGAEWGAWRIDQFARYYQGWQGWRGGADTIPHNDVCVEPAIQPVIKYTDTDNNGFFDLIEFDLNADKVFEERISLIDLELRDECEKIDLKKYSYKNYRQLFTKTTLKAWSDTRKLLKVATKLGIDVSVYNKLIQSKTISQKYRNAYWIKLFLYFEIKQNIAKNDVHKINLLQKGYFSNNFRMLLDL